MLNKNQQRAVDTTEGPLLIIAGAGSGKTTTLIHRTANIINKGTDPKSILLLTFTNKAADEMTARGIQLLDDRFNGITACTFHSFCHMFLRRHSYYLGEDKNFIVIDQSTATDTMKLIMSKNPDTDIKGFPSAASLVGLLSASNNMNIDIETAIKTLHEEWLSYTGIIIDTVEEYKKYKKDHNQFDYDDLMEKTVQLLEENEHIRGGAAYQYKYIMVDEYQDSNAMQLKLLKLLCDDKEHPNICAVGDDQQSIYLFRGADFMNILNFQKDFSGCELIILDENYRSNQEILDVANQIIEDAPDKIDKALKGHRTKGSKPVIVSTPDGVSESEFVMNKINDYLAKGINKKDICIISRGSRATAMIESELTKNKISYDKYGGLKFIDRQIVQDLLAALKISIDLHDEVAWFRWLLLYPGIGSKNAHKIYENISKTRDLTSLDKKTAGKFYPYIEDMNRVLEFLHNNDFPIAFDVLTKYYFDLRRLNIAKMKKDKRATEQGVFKEEGLLEMDMEDCENVLKLIAVKYTDAKDFLADMALVNTNLEEDDDRIVVSTVHSIKGLEYKVVFIYDCVEGAFPFTFAEREHNEPYAQEYSKKEMEEERRILYVAVTRAKDDLYIMSPRYVINYGICTKTKINRYLNSSIKKGLVDEMYF